MPKRFKSFLVLHARPETVQKLREYAKGSNFFKHEIIDQAIDLFINSHPNSPLPDSKNLKEVKHEV